MSETRTTNWGSIAALLVSVAAVLAGNGVMTTLVPVRAEIEGFGNVAIGLMGSAYFVGMLAGAYITPRFVARVGSLNAFALSSLGGAALLALLPHLVHPWSWILIRGISGLFLAGIYAVVEGYFQGAAENRYRGRLMGIYGVVQYIGWGLGGQVMRLGDPATEALFHLAALIVTLGLSPLLLMDRSVTAAQKAAPRSLRLGWLYQTSPIAVVATVLIGMANGTFWSLLPLYTTAIGLDGIATGTFVSVITIGAALAQFPVGRLSDAFDRRFVLLGLVTTCLVVEGIFYTLGARLVGLPLYLLGALMGAVITTQYYTVTAHTNDRTGRENVVSVSSAILFLYCVGAILGPLTASLLMEYLGSIALHLHNAGVHTALAVFIWLRIRRRSAPLRLPSEMAPQPGAGR